MRKNAKDPKPNPGRVFQMSQSSHVSQMFAMFAVFPRTRDAYKKQNTKKCGMPISKCCVGGPRVSMGSSANPESGIWNPEFDRAET